MKKAKVISFVATKHAAKARKFYEETLGLTFVSDDPFAIVFDVPQFCGMPPRHAMDIMLRVQKVEELVPARHTVLGWEVADIVAEIEQLTKRGVRFEHFEGMGQDELGVWTSPAGG